MTLYECDFNLTEGCHRLSKTPTGRVYVLSPTKNWDKPWSEDLRGICSVCAETLGKRLAAQEVTVYDYDA